MAHILSRVERTARRWHGGTVLLGLCCLCSALGCQRGDPAYAPGASDGPRAVEGRDGSGPTKAEIWEHFGRVGDLEVLGSFPSRGHGTGRWEAELRGSQGTGAAMAALIGPTNRMPVGSVLVERHTQRQGGVDFGLFAMQKREAGYFPAGGDWEFVVVGRDGRVEARGKLESCARCHAEAPVDFVFAPP